MLARTRERDEMAQGKQVVVTAVRRTNGRITEVRLHGGEVLGYWDLVKVDGEVVAARSSRTVRRIGVSGTDKFEDRDFDGLPGF